jgi:hypothetical protein
MFGAYGWALGYYGKGLIRFDMIPGETNGLCDALPKKMNHNNLLDSAILLSFPT